MARAKGIIFAFLALGKTSQTAALPYGAHTVTASGQYLMGIALMAHVPDQFITGHIEHMMQGHGQFNHPKPSAQMAARLGYRINHLCPNLISELLKLFRLKPTHIIRTTNLIKQLCFWFTRQMTLPYFFSLPD